MEVGVIEVNKTDQKKSCFCGAYLLSGKSDNSKISAQEKNKKEGSNVEGYATLDWVGRVVLPENVIHANRLKGNKEARHAAIGGSAR